MSKRGMGTKKPPAFKFTCTLSLPADVWNPDRGVFKTLSAEADSRTGLFAASIGIIMRGLGWEDGKILVGLLVDFLNHFPDEARMAVAVGIVEGLGMVVKREDDGVLVDMARLFTALSAGPKGEKRTPGGLILPGR